MDRKRFFSDLRQLIGSPGPNETTDAFLEPYVEGALEWLCAELRYRVVTETQAIGLVASQIDYPLPDDVMTLIRVEWNGNRLPPSSVFSWDRVSTNWPEETAGNPKEYALLGRRLYLLPPPSSSAVSTDGFLTLRYFAGPAGIGANGPFELDPVARRLALWEAALEYCISHPSDENQARAGAYGAQITRLLPGARDRATLPAEDFRPRIFVSTGRRGAAR